MNHFVKVRTGGKYLDILKTEKQQGDIFAGNPNDGHSDKIKVYRGGDSQTVSAEEYQQIEGEKEIEYTYTKHEVIEEGGVWRLKTESELLEDAKAKVKFELGNIVSKDIEYIMNNDTSKYKPIYSSIDAASTIEELKEIKIKV